MAESTQRPVGVTILGMLHIVGGSLAILGVLAGFVIGLVQKTVRPGIPLELLFAIGVLAFLGPGVGNAMLKGRSWSWYLTTFGYVCAAVVGGPGLPPLLRSVEAAAGLTDFITTITIAQVAVAALAALYLFTASAADFFTVNRRKRWLPLVAELAISAGLFFGVQALIAQWTAEPADASIQQLQAMGDRRANSEEDIQFMLDRLAEGVMEERVSAAWALGRSGRGDVIPPVLEAARDDRDVNVRINAVGAVAELGGKENLADLLAFLEDSESEVQAAALRGLADKRFSDSNAVEEIGRFMLENESLRGSAVDVLGNLENVAAVPFLQQVAKDSQEDVRTRVAFALGKLGDPAAVAILIDMLQDQRWTVRANAAQSLGMIGDPSARSALEAMRNDPNDQAKAAAESALSRLQ
jgi:hypothetical protein